LIALFHHVKYISSKHSRIPANKVFCLISYQYLAAAAACNRRLCMGFSKTFRITKTFHVAMLQRYKGFWDSGLSVFCDGFA
jgi:hypothetical protein